MAYERQRADLAREKGEAIYTEIRSQLKANGVPAGWYVLIDVESGEYHVAPSRVDLVHTFADKKDTLSWVRCIEYDEGENTDGATDEGEG
jgi:hypothetical protein